MHIKVFEAEKYLVALVHKSGSTSIERSLSGIVYSTTYKWSELSQTKPYIFWVRHPILRLASAYRMFAGRPSQPDGLVVTSWPAFVDCVLAGHDNPHMAAQASMLHKAPDIVHRFEDIAHTWGNYFDNPLKHMNKSKYVQTPTYRAEDLEKHYADDFELWRSGNKE